MIGLGLWRAICVAAGVLVLLGGTTIYDRAAAQGISECDTARHRVATYPLSPLGEISDLHHQVSPEQLQSLRIQPRGAKVNFKQDDFASKDKCDILRVRLDMPNGQPLLAQSKPIHLKVVAIRPKSAVSVPNKLEGGEYFPSQTETLTNIRIFYYFSNEQRAGTDKNKNAADASNYIRWSQPDKEGIYTVVLCVNAHECNPPEGIKAEVAEGSSSDNTTVPLPQLVGRRPGDRPAATSPGLDLAAMKINQSLRIKNGEVLPPSIAKTAKLRWKPSCDFDPFRETIGDLVKALFDTACLELHGAPDYRLIKVDVDENPSGLQVIGLIEELRKAELTGLKVDVLISGTNQRAGRNCILKFDIFDTADRRVFSETLQRNTATGANEMRGKSKLPDKKIEWRKIKIKVEPHKDADCRLASPDMVYAPEASDGSLAFEVDRDGRASFSVDVFPTKPDVSIVLLTYLGQPRAGSIDSTEQYYALGRTQSADTILVFLESALGAFKEVANRISILGLNAQGYIEEIEAVDASEIADPSIFTKKIIRKLKYPQREYVDLQVESVAKSVFDGALNRNARHLIVFGRSGLNHDEDYCGKKPYIPPDHQSAGDAFAMADFVAGQNIASNNLAFFIRESRDLYPTSTCPGTFPHYLFFPESASGTALGPQRKRFLDQFIDDVKKRGVAR